MMKLNVNAKDDVMKAVSAPGPPTTSSSCVIQQWNDQEDGRFMLQSLEYLDTVTLIQKVKPVNKRFGLLATNAIDAKCSIGQKFETNAELTDVVRKYCGSKQHVDNKTMEDIASTYGYPIDKWNVSNITNFSHVFRFEGRFDEPIGSWDVSNATTMNHMFYRASSFNQDISSWDVSNVTSMSFMFFRAWTFNQDLSSNVNVNDLGLGEFYGMFYNCKADAEKLPWFVHIMREDW